MDECTLSTRHHASRHIINRTSGCITHRVSRHIIHHVSRHIYPSVVWVPNSLHIWVHYRSIRYPRTLSIFHGCFIMVCSFFFTAHSTILTYLLTRKYLVYSLWMMAMTGVIRCYRISWKDGCRRKERETRNTFQHYISKAL